MPAPVSRCWRRARCSRWRPPTATTSTSTTEVTEFRRSSFFVKHTVTKAGVPALEGFETRLWTVRDPADPKRLKSGTMPSDILEAFKRG